MAHSAAQAGLTACHVCSRLYSAPHPLNCECCGAPLHQRKPNSLQYAWAWLITGFILYFPANLYPIMRTDMLGQSTDSTIIGGVVTLLAHQAYLVAIVVFVASVLIPLLKFAILAYLLIAIHKRSTQRRLERLRLYRLLEWVGRWSMIDVFVVAVLAALVQFGGLAQIIPGPAADAFAAVVVTTMLAANALDPRLIWD
jgi:paraquat-inducible protein A